MPTTKTRCGPPIRRHTPFREAAKRTLTAGGLGSVGEKAATAIADFVVLDMFANYCTGREDVKGVDRDRRAAAASASIAKQSRPAGAGNVPPAIFLR